MHKFLDSISRRKVQGEEDLAKSQLARVLGAFDLTLLGTGSTMGVGVYVLAGQVAKDFAGPGVIVSFFIAAVASIFAGFCYAEFGARVPKAGSAYAYCYYTIGELVAFVIGWNLILEYLIGAASVTKGLSSYIDNLIGGHISDFFTRLWPMNVPFLGDYPDFFAFAVVCLISVFLAFGVKESSWVNNICTGINLAVVVFVIIAGSIRADSKNWMIPKEEIPEGVNGGDGGFLPFGVTGVIKGAATCFYGYIGFDCIAATGEEVKNPQKSIPRAIIASLTIIFLAYFGMSTTLTLMVPYFDQSREAPFTVAFEKIGWIFAKWVVSIGAIFGLFPSLLGSLVPLPRIAYAMANDGLLYRVFGRVSRRYHSPMVGTFISGFLTGIMALLFNLSQLVDMMSIGTLIAYSIVAACVLLLRYRKTKEDEDDEEEEDDDGFGGDSTLRQFLVQIFNGNGAKKPTNLSSSLVSYMTILFCALCFGAMSCVAFYIENLSAGEPVTISILGIQSALLILAVVSIGMQPQSKATPSFKVPMVPAIPCISIAINVYLMLMLDRATWLRFAAWMSVGVVIYFSYGIWHSEERHGSNLASKSEMTIATDITDSCGYRPGERTDFETSETG